MGEVCWSTLSLHGRIIVFEHKANDTCLAVCLSWRDLVNSSHITSLHLYANSAQYKHR